MRLTWRTMLAAALATAPAAASFSVSPQSVVMDLAPGARKRVQVTVVNELPVARPLRYFPAPFRQKLDGTYEIVAEADTLLSCHGWFPQDTVSSVLGASEARVVSIDIVVPRNVTGTRFGAVVFDLLPADSAVPGEPEAAVGLVMRMPAYFELTVGGRLQRSRAELTDVKVLTPAELGGVYAQRLPPDALGVKALVRNSGPVRFEVGGHAVVRDSSARRVKSFPLASGSVLPGAEVELLSVLAPLRRGRYALDVAVDFGAASPVKGSVEFHAGREAGVSGPATTVPQLDVTVNPERLEMNLPPRSTRVRPVTVRNESDRAVRLKASLVGLEGFADGTLDQTEAPDASSDCRAWTTLEPAEAVLPPRSSRNLKLTFTPPADAVGGRYGCLYLEEADASAASGSATTPSLAVPLLLTVEGTHARSAELVRVAGDPHSGMAVILANTGAVHLSPVARAAILRQTQPGSTAEFDYQPVGTLDLGSGVTMLPGDTIAVSGKYEQQLPEGEYKMDIVVDCGKGLRLASSGQFKVGKR
ncbi:MAG: hypothetical protein R6X13_06360 [bacterium]